MTDLTGNILDREIRMTIKNYEPRIKIQSLQVIPNTVANAFQVNMTFYVGNNTTPTAVNLLLQRSR